LAKDEDVVTGSFYFPLPEQLDNPFVLSQVTTEAYSAALINSVIPQASYSQGLLGGNSAVRRLVLEQAGAFCSPVQSGTDFELALRLRKAGKRIRYQTTSVIQAEFPTELNAYFRQQSRWIRNLVIHWDKGGDRNLVIAALRTSLIGVAMLALPLICFLAILIGDLIRMAGYGLLILWASIFAFMVLARIRYAAFTRRWLGIKIPIVFLFLLPLYCLIDFIAWSSPLIEYTSFSMRQRW
jgi:cellulose synthase/poly-beta-1,6-N-acetylglucosamine synthase-like glycosyltransferase